MKVVNLLFQILNPFPAGLIVSLAAPKFLLKPFPFRLLGLVQRNQLFDICLYTFKHIIKAKFSCPNAKLAKYLHLHKNFN